MVPGRADKALRESEDKFRQLFTRMPNAVAIYDAVDGGEDFIFKDFNAAAEKIEGIKKDDLIGKRVTQVFPGVKGFGIFAVFQRVWRTGQPEFFPSAIYRDERDPGTWRENWVFRLASGEVVAIYHDITERKRTEEALRESEDKYRTVFENTGTATVVVEENNIISLANAEFAKLSGFSKDDIEGKKKWTEFVVKEDLERMLDQHRLRRQNHEKALTHYEFRFVTKSGDIRNIYLSIDVIPRTKKSVASLMDITERKRAELELESALESLNEAHRLAHIGTWDWVMENDTVTWSKELYNIAGRDPSLPAPTYAEHPRVYTPASWDRLSGAVTRALTAGEPYNLELELVRPDSSIRWVNAFGGVKRNGNGNVIGLHGTVQDITDRKQAEEALRESEVTFKALAENANDGILVAVSDGVHAYANRRAGEITGYSIAELLKTSIKDLAAPGELEHLTERFTKRLLGEDIPKQYETVIIHKDGKSVPIEITAAKTFWQGQPAVIVVIRDITERKRAEEHLKRFNEELEKQVSERTEALNKSLHEKEILFKEVHHRVKNNMQIIISLLNLQSRTLEDPTLLKTIKESQNRIRAMALVHERLYRSGDISTIDLKDYIQFLARELLSFYGVKSQRIRFNVNAPAINVNIDTAIPLGLMVNELISNAIKYAFPEDMRGEIVIDITKNKNNISFVVRDNGVGIPADFDWRNSKSLGLRLVISLVEQLFGTIELNRTAGTKFTIIVREKE